MFIENLLENKQFSKYQVNKKDIIKSEKFNIVFICLDKNQEILPHPEPYGVAFIVLEGEGIFTTKDGEFKLKRNSMIFIRANEIRGIKSLDKLVIIGIQDGH
jgi:quercetin dioxygenase-like cupin family protein